MYIKKEDIRDSLSTLPELPGCYRYNNKEGNCIYVGKAKNLRRRISSYFQREHDDPKTRSLVRNIHSLEYMVVRTEHDALLLENNLIKEYQPIYNIMLKEGNRYPFICITNEPFPRVFVTHKRERDGSTYYGPYPFIGMAWTLVKLFRKLFKFRTCRLALTTEKIAEGRFNKCLQYHIKRCYAPCEGLQSQENYIKMVKKAKRILNGEIAGVVDELTIEMKALAEDLKFEEAQELLLTIEALKNHQGKSTIISDVIGNALVASYTQDLDTFYFNYLELSQGSIIAGRTYEYRKRVKEDAQELFSTLLQETIQDARGEIREIIVPEEPAFALPPRLTVTVPQRGDRRKVLELSLKNVEQYRADKNKQAEKLNPEQRRTTMLRELQTKIGLPTLPYHIECFDNSNIAGEYPVAACVVYKGAMPSKKDYRLYHIKGVSGQDDYASMEEVVTRRYSRLIEEGSGLPDLIITDGGKGHMSTVIDALKNMDLDIPVLGLAKDDRHKTANILFGDPPELIGIMNRSQSFNLLERIQNEVHRFAITFHRKVRSKGQRESELDKIKGIGPVTKQRLLQELKSVKRIKSSSLGELATIIGPSKASIVYNYFKPNESSHTESKECKRNDQ